MVRSERLVVRLHVDLRRQASALCAGFLGHACR
jgi:hypothetical protein